VASTDRSSYLTLGWRVDNNLNPAFWLQHHSPRPGLQVDSDLIQVPAATLGCHTAIVAQSGSGKSFFLGRLIEELILKTKARCVILDPNADFRRINETVGEERWLSAQYSQRDNRGFLPHEATAESFSVEWQAVEKKVRGGPTLPTESGERLSLDWPSLSMEVLADAVVPMLRSELYHCHEFVKAIGGLIALKHTASKGTRTRRAPDIIDETSRLLGRLRSMATQERRDRLEEIFDAEQLSKAPEESLASGIVGSSGRVRNRLPVMRMRIRQRIDRAIAASDYISEDVARYYFGKAREYVAQGIVQFNVTYFSRSKAVPPRVEVIDLPSFPDNKTRYLALNSVLTTIWERSRIDWALAAAKPENADERVPTFIVVDEAHNLIPRENQDLAVLALREQFRSIAAEGRKYGLFLVLCTQRPDKIDEFVLSECENRAIMRIGSQSVLDETKTLMGLEDIPERTLSRCMEFGMGRALLVGRWAAQSPSQGIQLYTAMRRTVEGGRNLRADHWATPILKELPTQQTPSEPAPVESVPSARVPRKDVEPKELVSQPRIGRRPRLRTASPPAAAPPPPSEESDG
jgi:hypothetical protein